MFLRHLALAAAVATVSTGAAFAQSQTTSPALTPSSGGQGDSATTTKSEQDPTLGSGAVKPKTPHAARPHSHHTKAATPNSTASSGL